MFIGSRFVTPICLLAVFVIWLTGSLGVFIPNLTQNCYRCLCYVSTECDVAHGCTGGYCGPFNISRVYWVDAGMVVLPADDLNRNHAWEDCARSYHCAQKIIEEYLSKFGKDCNNDGVTDCYDYMMVNGNGGYSCAQPLNRTANGRRWLQRFDQCRGVFIPNLTQNCYRCLCYVSTECDVAHGCTGGYCGPFNISRVYWVDAGMVVLPADDLNRNHAWEDCARSYHCAQKIIEGYLSKFGKDCNNDGVTDCYDYMMVNGNGGYSCAQPLNRTANGRRWLQRFDQCRGSL